MIYVFITILHLNEIVYLFTYLFTFWHLYVFFCKSMHKLNYIKLSFILKESNSHYITFILSFLFLGNVTIN